MKSAIPGCLRKVVKMKRHISALLRKVVKTKRALPEVLRKVAKMQRRGMRKSRHPLAYREQIREEASRPKPLRGAEGSLDALCRGSV